MLVSKLCGRVEHDLKSPPRHESRSRTQVFRSAILGSATVYQTLKHKTKETPKHHHRPHPTCDEEEQKTSTKQPQRSLSFFRLFRGVVSGSRTVQGTLASPPPPRGQGSRRRPSCRVRGPSIQLYNTLLAPWFEVIVCCQ